MTNEQRQVPDRSDGDASVERARMSPKARRLAREHGIEPSQVQGSGADGVILADDVFRALADAARAHADAERARSARLTEEAVRLEQQRRVADENARVERERLAAAATAEVARLEQERAVRDAESADRERTLSAEKESARLARERAEADGARLESARATLETERTKLAVERAAIEAERVRVETERASLENQRSRLETDKAEIDARRESLDDTRADTRHGVVAQVAVRRDVDVSAVIAACEGWNGRLADGRSVQLSHLDIIVAAVARALRQHPRLNAYSDGAAVVQNEAINIALAVAVGDDVLAPVIRAADRVSLGELAQRRRDLVARAESRQLHASDAADATFTISAFGLPSVDAFTARVVAPQACHLAVGSITDRVIAVDGLIGVRPTVSLTLSCDGRVVHAPRAAAFLNDVASAIGEPRNIWDL